MDNPALQHYIEADVIFLQQAEVVFGSSCFYFVLVAEVAVFPVFLQVIFEEPEQAHLVLLYVLQLMQQPTSIFDEVLHGSVVQVYLSPYHYGYTREAQPLCRHLSQPRILLYEYFSHL